MDNQIIIFSFLGGMLPALFWLWFWLKEDTLNPEPRKYIIYSFIIGIFSAIFAIPFEGLFYDKNMGIFSLLVLVFIEEFFKYEAAYLSALRKSYVDEPIDAVIYMITVALGFSAIENVFFLRESLISGIDLLDSVSLGNMRFIGAMLLHTLSSGIIGVFIALSFFKSKIYKKIFLIIGFILAVGLHTLFNLSIINSNDQGESIFYIFAAVWLGVIILLLLFEKIKRLKIKNNL